MDRTYTEDEVIDFCLDYLFNMPPGYINIASYVRQELGEKYGPTTLIDVLDHEGLIEFANGGHRGSVYISGFGRELVKDFGGWLKYQEAQEQEKIREKEVLEQEQRIRDKTEARLDTSEYIGSTKIIIIERDRQEYDDKLDAIISEVEKLREGQGLIYDDIIRELEELKGMYDLGKKHWGQMVKGKVMEMVLKGAVQESVIKPLLKMVGEDFSRLLN
jgi:hypothetical protein